MKKIRRKAPPFAKQFYQLNEKCPLAWVYLGPFAWEGRKKTGRTVQQSVVLPPGDDPEHYTWDFLRGQVVFALCQGNTLKDYRQRLAAEVLNAGAVHVRFFMPDSIIEGLESPETEPNQEGYYNKNSAVGFAKLLANF